MSKQEQLDPTYPLNGPPLTREQYAQLIKDIGEEAALEFAIRRQFAFCDGCESLSGLLDPTKYGHTCCPFQTCQVGYCDCEERTDAINEPPRKLADLRLFVRGPILKFEMLQKRYDDFGAWDTEASFSFHQVIEDAVRNKPFEPKRYYWSLYSCMEGYEKVEEELLQAAKEVYDAIRKFGRIEDIPILAKYAWRMSF